jgi:hypothetical protein
MGHMGRMIMGLTTQVPVQMGTTITEQELRRIIIIGVGLVY